MKEVSATLRNLQISPRKVRLVADLIRGASVTEARRALSYNPKQAARPVLKLLNSAVANADHNFHLDTTSLRIKTIMVGEGRTLKRYMPRAFGRATQLRKRASHIKIVLEGEETNAPATKKAEKKAEDKQEETAAKRPEKKQPEDTKENAGKGVQPSAKSKKPEPVDPRRQGKERPTQHMDKKNKRIIST
jgi:large subunit ribosomal protein L22